MAARLTYKFVCQVKQHKKQRHNKNGIITQERQQQQQATQKITKAAHNDIWHNNRQQNTKKTCTHTSTELRWIGSEGEATFYMWMRFLFKWLSVWSDVCMCVYICVQIATLFRINVTRIAGTIAWRAHMYGCRAVYSNNSHASSSSSSSLPSTLFLLRPFLAHFFRIRFFFCLLRCHLILSLFVSQPICWADCIQIVFWWVHRAACSTSNSMEKFKLNGKN